MGIKGTVQSFGKAAVKYVVMPVLLAGASVAMTAMKPIKPATHKSTLQQNNELRLVNEKYTLRTLKIRFDEGTGNYEMQLSGFSNGGDSTGTGKPTQMFLGFRSNRGAPENVTGNSSVITVNDFKFNYDARYNNQVDVDLDIKQNFHGRNRSVFTIIPAVDPLADPEKSGPFEANQHYAGTVLVQVTDMSGRPVQNPRNALGQIKGMSVLGTPIEFKQNMPGQYNFYRTTLLGDGQQQGNYFREEMQLTGAQYKLNN